MRKIWKRIGNFFGDAAKKQYAETRKLDESNSYLHNDMRIANHTIDGVLYAEFTQKSAIVQQPRNLKEAIETIEESHVRMRNLVDGIKQMPTSDELQKNHR